MRADRFEGTAIGEAAALTCAAVFSVVAGRYLWLDDASTQVQMLIGLPIAACILAVSLRSRELVWTALGLCLGAGMIGLFSIGMPLLPMGLALFAWWAQVARRTRQPIVTGDDLAWEMVGFVAAVMTVSIAL